MDNLENFIRSKREEFDQASPDLRVWSNIDQSLEKRRPTKRFSLRRSLSIAAGVLLLIGLGTLIGMQLRPVASSQRSLGDISLEYQELEQYYEAQLREKTAQLAGYDKSDASVGDDLRQLEDFLQELQAELAEAPRGSEEQIVNAMIENYQHRLEILERVLSRIQSKPSKNEEIDNNEELSL